MALEIAGKRVEAPTSDLYEYLDAFVEVFALSTEEVSALLNEYLSTR